jgi:hypothetical protein
MREGDLLRTKLDTAWPPARDETIIRPVFQTGNNSVKIQLKIMGLKHRHSIMLSNKCNKFQPVPFIGFGDTNLQAELNHCEANAQVQ